MNYDTKKVLISGGSAGIGRALIEELVNKGVKHMAVIGRRKEPLEALPADFQGVHFLLIQGDVSRPEDLDKAIATVKKEWGGLDILINNAGVVSAGLLSSLSDEDILQQINVNVSGLILLTKKALPLLTESSEGAIINLSSGFGYIAMPFYSVYAATKAAVRQFSDGLRRELHQYPLHIMTVSPSATDTPMMQNAQMGKMDSPQEVARKSVEALERKEINLIFGGKQREEEIRINFLEPEKIDQYAIANYEGMRQASRNHRAM